MTGKFIYPGVISKVLTESKDHLNGKTSLNDLQFTVQQAEASILSFEEKDIKNFFTNIEGKLELVKFTVNDADQLTESKKIASEILEWFEKRKGK